MNHLDFRQKLFEFWTQPPRNHTVVPSSSLVPENDPTTLFTGSGMQPMIPYLLGQPHPLGTRLVDIQKCFRGQDIEEVGDNRHDSFFEMTGNWSLGDYFKKEQIEWVFEFLTKVLKFDINKLHVTCFSGYKSIPKDDEAPEIWKGLGVSEDHIHYYAENKNWWSRSGKPQEMPIGEIGGPSSEIFYEFSHVKHDPKYGEECHPNCDCGRFLEIGNCVFITYQKTGDNEFTELKQKNIDFGGGFERTLAALNDNPDIFKTSLFSTIITSIEKISGCKYGEGETTDWSFRVVADHIKASTFLISEGVLPSNVDRGYVLRRLIRRAIRLSRNLGVSQNFIGKVVGSVVETYETVYPELKENVTKIVDVINAEETKFRNTLEKGLKEFEKISAKGSLSAEEVFYLYESFGFPYELSEEEAKLKKISIASREDFQKAFGEHKEKSRSASKGMFKGGLADNSEINTRYHTATHLLQAALRKILGTSVHQEGSNITNERMRFDFTFGEKMTAEQISQVEKIVNEQIEEDLIREVETQSYEEAIENGALAFFKERYPEKVTVYTFKNPKTGEVFSKEICGGPHVEHTNLLGKFSIMKEESVSAGVRRIYAKLEG